MKSKYKVIGLMSGTSLDGLDIASCVFFVNNNKWEYSIEYADTVPYPYDLLKALKDAISYPEKYIMDLDIKLGHFFADEVNSFIAKYKLTPDIISSHGHTIFHQPEKAYTLQIGNGKIIAEETGVITINDFRSGDVKLGGQGAPLVPIGDLHLFSDYTACINLGGFCNISHDDAENNRIAYDISPCNLILNKAARNLSLDYDYKGEHARTGNVFDTLLEELNSIPFYTQSYPKSLGREWLKKAFFPVVNKYDIPPEDQLATFVEHVSDQIALSLSKLPAGKVLISGGGTYNSFLAERIINKSKQEVIIPSQNIIDYKEALIFAFLGVLRLRTEVNILSSVTGASHDHVAGTIHKKT